MNKSLVALSLALLAAANAPAQTLAGDVIDAGMYFTVDTGYGVGRISGHGLDGPFEVVDGTSDARQYSSTFTLDVDGSQFTLRFITFAGWQEGVLFRLSDLDFTPGGGPLSSLTVDTNLVGYQLTVGPDFVDIGLGGTRFNADTYFIGSFNATPAVPEPSTYALMLGGLAAAAAVARRSRRSRDSY